MKLPIISVIIPTYKPQAYIEQCLKSLEDQTLDKSKFEIILILNGCGEPYISYAQSVLKEFSSLNVSFLHTETAGVSHARNMGLDLAKGEYITFIDDDDWISACYLEEMLRLATTDVIPLTNVVTYDEATDSYSDYYITKVYKKYSSSIGCSLVDVRSYFSVPYLKLLSVNIVDGRTFSSDFKNGEDSLFMTTISDRCKRFKFTSPEAIYYRRVRSGSATTVKRLLKDKVLNDLRLISRYFALYFSNPYSYSFLFILTRVLASLRRIVQGFIR